MERISLVIVTYNSSKHIFDCLDSVLKYNDIGDELEIIIVDNASTEQASMFKKIKEKYDNRVVLVDSGKNGGYGFGNNVGIKKSISPIVIVMNPDVRLVQPIFKKILVKMSNESIGVLGVSFIDGSLPFYMKPEKVHFFNQLIHPLVVKLKLYNEKRMYMSGSFLTFNKDAFVRAGCFDEKIFMYTEEPDITNRLQKSGFHAEWCPEIQVRHLAHGRDFNQTTEEMVTQSLLYYFKKYNADLKQNLIVKIELLRLKRCVAKLLNNKFKQGVFDKRFVYLKNVLIELEKR